MTRLPYGIYDALLDKELQEALDRHPELRSVLGKIDDEEQPGRYAAFIAGVVEQTLREETDPAARLTFCNRLIEMVAGISEVLGHHSIDFTRKHYARFSPDSASKNVLRVLEGRKMRLG